MLRPSFGFGWGSERFFWGGGKRKRAGEVELMADDACGMEWTVTQGGGPVKNFQGLI